MTRVYVIGSSAELERAERVIASLRERGAEVVGDWTASVRAARAAGHASDATVGREDAMRAARANRHAIEWADVVIALVPEMPSTGYGYDLAIAHASMVDVIRSGEPRSIYDHVVTCAVESDEAAIDAAMEWA